MRRAAAWLSVALVLGLAAPLAAQTGPTARERTLADVRQDLNVLYIEIQRLKRELSTTGGPEVTPSAGGPILDRVDAIEGALQRLTARTEELEHRVERIVEDGTQRIGDLEFRLVELEGGDVSALEETTTLGGEVDAPAPDPAPEADAPQLAVGEEADFEAATAALEAGEAGRAAALFRAFREDYPGSPLAPRAALGLGRALAAEGDTRAAARVWLDGFSAHPDAEVADETLYRLGDALAALGQTEAACPILADVGVRFPDSPFAGEAAARREGLSCP
jgi:tol-pal system protein YbgF